MMEIIFPVRMVEESEHDMKISTSLTVGFIATTVIGVGSVLLYKEYQQTKLRVVELEGKVQATESVAKAQAKSGEIKDDQAKQKIIADAAADRLSRDVASLRKSIKNLEQKSADSLETCQRSLSVAGEVSGECAERYSTLAGKAEQMKIDYSATVKHVEVLEGLLSDLTGLEPLK